MAVERMLHVDPLSKLKKILAEASAPQQSLPRQYGNQYVQAHTATPRPHTGNVDARLYAAAAPAAPAETAKVATDLITLFASVTDDQLPAVVGALSSDDYSTLNFTVDGAPNGNAAKLGARVAMASTNAQLATAMSENVNAPSFAWVLADKPSQARAAAFLKRASPAVRIRALARIDAPSLLAMFKQAGVDTKVTGAEMSAASTSDQSDAVQAIFMKDVSTPVEFNDADSHWAVLAPELQAGIIATFDQPHSYDALPLFAVTVACVFGPSAPKSMINTLNVTLPNAGPNTREVVFPTSYAARLQALRKLLTPQARASLDANLEKVTPDLASQIGVVAPKASPVAAPATPAAAPAPVLHEVGAVVAPEIHEDHGHLDDGHGNIDNSKRRKATAADYAAKAKWIALLEAARIAKPDWTDAIRTYSHFLIDNNGADLPFSYEKFAKDDPSGAQAVTQAMQDVRDSAVTHSDADGGHGEHFLMESGVIEVGSSNAYPYPQTENWQKAIGGHEIWLDADVKVDATTAGQRTFTIAMTLHAQDRYNFNPGAADLGSNTPDDANGVFEVTGLGKEFLSKSTLQRSFTFTQPAAVHAPGQAAPRKKPVLAKKSAAAAKPAT